MNHNNAIIIRVDSVVGDAGLLSSLGSWIEEYGVVGVFLISLVGNAIPYSTVPYIFGIAAYASRLTRSFDIYIVILAGAFGAALGKIVVYMMGRAAHAKVSEKTKQNLDVFVRMFRRSAFLAIFLFAALPLPDDVIYVPLGVAGYSLKYFFIGVFLGKIIITGFAVLAGKTLGILIEMGSNINPILLTIILVALIIAITLAIIEIDWLEIANKYSNMGWIAGFKEFLYQVFLLLTLKSPRRYYEKARDKRGLSSKV